MGNNNLHNAKNHSKIDEDALSLLITAFELYSISKSHRNVYKNDSDNSICRNLLVKYYKLVDPDYRSMILNFKRKYVPNEALVEKNDTPEEKKGLALAYDYITGYDVEKEEFNIFINALIIHGLLYKPLDDKNAADYKQQREEIEKLLEEAKIEKNIVKYKEAKELLKNCQEQKFGGQLRKGPVVMQNFNANIPEAADAVNIFNNYLSPEKKKEFYDALNDKNILNYIDYCVKTTAYLIGVQPFGDGNKRTFRTVLNLMFKERNIPPVYITKKERSAYHDALEKAIRDNDYDDLIVFYYYKICDSIYELDFAPYLKYIEENQNGKEIEDKKEKKKKK